MLTPLQVEEIEKKAKELEDKSLKSDVLRLCESLKQAWATSKDIQDQWRVYSERRDQEFADAAVRWEQRQKKAIKSAMNAADEVKHFIKVMREEG